MSAGPAPWPVELRYARGARVLEIDWEDGRTDRLPAEFLRVESPSAEVKGHGGTKPPPVAGKRGVSVLAIEPVGNYAVRLRFDDGHDTGLYSFALLARLAREQDRLWSEYLDRLARHGLTRG